MPFLSLDTIGRKPIKLATYPNLVLSSDRLNNQKALRRMADARKRFLNLFPKLVDELVGVLVKEGMPQDAQDWYRKTLEHNTPGGKLNRGLSVVDTVQILQGKEKLDDAEYEKAAILGWCVELVS